MNSLHIVGAFVHLLIRRTQARQGRVWSRALAARTHDLLVTGRAALPPGPNAASSLGGFAVPNEEVWAAPQR